MRLSTLWNEDRKTRKSTKISKFVGWCSDCGMMQAKTDGGICPRCDCATTTSEPPMMKEILTSNVIKEQ